MEAFAAGVRRTIKRAEASVDDVVRAARRGDIVLDVRSPGEYARGHIPGATSMPLFTDDERAKVGIAFAKQGRGVAMVLGMKATRPKLEDIIATASALVEERKKIRDRDGGDGERGGATTAVYVHCWRGGMRSSSVAWFLRRSLADRGVDVRVMRGGYKAFRRWASPPRGPNVCIVGGRTGVGKTRALLALRDAGEQVIDLEGLASHSGSAFGWVGRPPEQPTSEHFSNLVACAWAGSRPSPRWVFIEDEGPHVGKCSVDPGLFHRMRHAPLVVNVVAPSEVRLRVLVEDYASEEHRAAPGWLESMTESLEKLQKRLGGERCNSLVTRLRSGDYTAVAEGLLEYYDDLYDRHLGKKRVEKGAIKTIAAETQKPRGGVQKIVNALPVGEARDGRHPDALDVDALVMDILKTVRAFEEEDASVP
ncbi:uncharacterized protein MICPUCDRAFT_30706 [Micromonas pusilla CCMP1545]|uniref:Predicted protein n=1 Tax=Micromonas pusilla (strain CCMP1545) TaxID=564608 RepID=C1MH25_MICPC|nr:uncharacterized protein MICPUCDRAFT_30706 [Micromonas pusilla CCMP1545]EEH60131.1 predicted protein [Micromonas pusilla CCMP1545]|eukprot:XP_003054879.1 predicted protein [Micromonas pusilla CCMP1545]